MNIHYTARQGHLTPDIKAYCDRRLAELKRLMGFATDVDVILSHEKSRQKAEIHVRAKGGGLVVIEESPDMMNSLHLAFDALEKKIRKEREKYREKKRRGGRERKSFALPAAEAGEGDKRVIRADHFSAKPLTLMEIAQEIGVHESTVGRVVANKYIITPRGVFSLKYFFHKALHGDLGEDVSSLRIKERLRKLVESEDKNHPLSDMELEEILARENFKIARRTVAKYRKQLKIHPSHIRKRKFIMEGTA